jgi:ubiquinone/menaquinone biosynthesis C-methylase UbiE
MIGKKQLWESLNGFWTVWVIHFGRRHGLLEALNGSVLDAEQVAGRTALSLPVVRAWLGSAHALGVVRRSRGGYTLPKRLAVLLLEEEDVRFMGGLVSYYALRSLDFDCADMVFRGSTCSNQTHMAEAFAEGTKWDHTAFLKILLEAQPDIKTIFSGGGRVLDVGCGAGRWVAKMASIFPQTLFVGVDKDPHMIEEAKRNCSHISNATFHESAAEEINYEDEFDLVYLGEVLYAVTDKMRALSACRRALKNGGYLVVCEAVVAGREKLVRAALLDYVMQGAATFNRKSLLKLLRDSGFEHTTQVGLGGGLWFFVSRKV